MSDGICVACQESRSVARGLCKRCYKRLSYQGRLGDYPKQEPRQSDVCEISGCNRKPWAKDLCSMHYQRKRKTGTTAPPPAPVPLWLRIVLGRTIDAETGCWVWQGYRHPKGYGRVRLGKVSASTHRTAYETFVGPIPDGLEIDHLCFNRACCNPEHLEPVTAAENMRRMGRRRAERNRQNRPIPKW